MKRIMFSDRYGLTQAVLKGKKTMTRRIIPLCENDLNFLKIAERGEWLFSSRTCLDGAYPAYNVGEEVAVAQSYKAIGLTFISPPDTQWGCTYEMSGYSNKMFVRADLMPRRIRITNIKAERLQDISEEDCLREGIKKMEEGMPYRFDEDNGKIHLSADPRMLFADLIDRISGKGTWNRNPWVFAYEFELVK